MLCPDEEALGTCSVMSLLPLDEGQMKSRLLGRVVQASHDWANFTLSLVAYLRFPSGSGHPGRTLNKHTAYSLLGLPLTFSGGASICPSKPGSNIPSVKPFLTLFCTHYFCLIALL